MCWRWHKLIVYDIISTCHDCSSANDFLIYTQISVWGWEWGWGGVGVVVVGVVVVVGGGGGCQGRIIKWNIILFSVTTSMEYSSIMVKWNKKIYIFGEISFQCLLLRFRCIVWVSCEGWLTEPGAPPHKIQWGPCVLLEGPKWVPQIWKCVLSFDWWTLQIVIIGSLVPDMKCKLRAS